MPGLEVSGFAWPFRFGPLGHPNRKTQQGKIEQNIVGTALTAIGEHFREKGFGTIGYRAVFKNLNSTRLTYILGLVEDACIEFEPRVILGNLSWEKREDYEGSAIYITIPYKIRETGQTGVAEAKLGE